MIDIRIDTTKKLSPVSPILYGIFFEDINYAGDGGLYAELVANRSFEYYDREDKTDKSKMCWETIGDCDFTITDRLPLSLAHRQYARLTGQTGSGLRNLGFCREGLAVSQGKEFRFSCYARNASPCPCKSAWQLRTATFTVKRSFPWFAWVALGPNIR